MDDIILNKTQKNNNGKKVNDIIRLIQKSNGNNIVMRNKKGKNKGLNTKDEINDIIGYDNNSNDGNYIKKNKSFNSSKNVYSISMPKRKNKNKIDYNSYNKGINIKNKKKNLTSQKTLKSKHKRKIK